MGFHQNLPRSIVFAPRAMGGVGLCNLQHEMDVQQLLILLWHLHAQTMLGKAIEILLQQYQLWAGLNQHILEDTWPCQWIPNHWISRIHQTLHTYNIKAIHNAWTFQQSGETMYTSWKP